MPYGTLVVRSWVTIVLSRVITLDVSRERWFIAVETESSVGLTNSLRLEWRTFSGWSYEHSPVGVTNIIRLKGRTFPCWSDGPPPVVRRLSGWIEGHADSRCRRRTELDKGVQPRRGWIYCLWSVVIGWATDFRRKLVIRSVDIRCFRCSSSVFGDFRSPSQDFRLYASWVISFDNNYWGFSHWSLCTQTI